MVEALRAGEGVLGRHNDTELLHLAIVSRNPDATKILLDRSDIDVNWQDFSPWKFNAIAWAEFMVKESCRCLADDAPEKAEAREILVLVKKISSDINQADDSLSATPPSFYAEPRACFSLSAGDAERRLGVFLVGPKVMLCVYLEDNKTGQKTPDPSQPAAKLSTAEWEALYDAMDEILGYVDGRAQSGRNREVFVKDLSERNRARVTRANSGAGVWVNEFYPDKAGKTRDRVGKGIRIPDVEFRVLGDIREDIQRVVQEET